MTCMCLPTAVWCSICARSQILTLLVLKMQCSHEWVGGGVVLWGYDKVSWHLSSDKNGIKFEDMLMDQVHNYLQLYDVSLLLHSDKYPVKTAGN